MKSIKLNKAYIIFSMLFAILIMSCGKDAMSNGKGVNTIQAMLNSGETPKELFDNNVPLDSLYGKMYKGGLIFYLNTSDGTGMIAATENQIPPKTVLNTPSEGAEWGCLFQDIIGLNNVLDEPDNLEEIAGARIGDGMTNTNAIIAECLDDNIAAKLCRDVGPEWFLPSLGELNLMHINLSITRIVDFKDPETGGSHYWSSTEASSELTAWFQVMTWQSGNRFDGTKNNTKHVRAVRAF